MFCMGYTVRHEAFVPAGPLLNLVDIARGEPTSSQDIDDENTDKLQVELTPAILESISKLDGGVRKRFITSMENAVRGAASNCSQLFIGSLALAADQV